MNYKMLRSPSKLLIALTMVLGFNAAQADVILGAFNFNSVQFGDTLIASDGGTSAVSNWLNTVNANPGSPGYLTGANFDTGIANIGAPTVSYTIGYNTPIVNNAGVDFGIVVARYSSDSFLLALSGDGTTFTSDSSILNTTAVSTGVNRTYFYGGGGPFGATLFVHSIDLSDFGFASGASIAAVRITGNTELDLIRAAGFGDRVVNGVPEPASLVLLGIGLAGLGVIRRRKTV